jgi:quinol monooxygenase YgiN
MAEVIVMARAFAAPGKADALEKALSAIVPTVRKEKGCLRYDLHRSLEDPSVFMFYETWADAAALAAHAVSTHMVEMRKKITNLVTAPTEVTKWRRVDGA